MATTDPKYTIKNIVAVYIAANPILKDDNVTSTLVLCEYEGGPEDLDYLFFNQNYDVIISFGEPKVRSMRDIQDVPVHYAENISVTVTTTDKFDLLGNRVCTAAKIQNKAGIAIRAAIEGSAQSVSGAVPVYTVKVLEERGNHRRIGARRYWETPYIVEYKNA